MSRWDQLLKDKNEFTIFAKKAFDKVDQDGSGELDFKELKLLLCTIADELETTHPTNAQVFEAINLLDKDGNHKINLNEFEVLVYKMLKMFASK